MRRGLSMLEMIVSLTILALVLTASLGTYYLGKKDRRDWDEKTDTIYSMINGMERIRRELEDARLVAYPGASNSRSYQRPFLVVVDAEGQVVIYSVTDGNLAARTLPLAGQPAGPPRVLIARVDRVVFHHRSDTLAVRFQIFMGGLSLISTVRAANDLDPATLDVGDLYGI